MSPAEERRVVAEAVERLRAFEEAPPPEPGTGYPRERTAAALLEEAVGAPRGFRHPWYALARRAVARRHRERGRELRARKVAAVA